MLLITPFVKRADPPWQYNTMYQNLQGVAPYPTMSWEELADLPVGKLADPKMCALFCWATGPLIHKTIALMEHWGFEYKTVMKVWRKTNADGSPVCNPGWWSRSSCEFLLVGTKGANILKYKTTNSERQEYASVREGHSAKPGAITQAVADFLAVPGPRIELWARDSHPLFDSWGRFPVLLCLSPALAGARGPLWCLWSLPGGALLATFRQPHQPLLHARDHVLFQDLSALRFVRLCSPLELNCMQGHIFQVLFTVIMTGLYPVIMETSPSAIEPLVNALMGGVAMRMHLPSLFIGLIATRYADVCGIRFPICTPPVRIFRPREPPQVSVPFRSARFVGLLFGEPIQACHLIDRLGGVYECTQQLLALRTLRFGHL